MELKEFAYLEHHDGNTVFDMFKVSDIMSTPVVVMNSIESAGTIETILLQTTHNGQVIIFKRGTSISFFLTKYSNSNC